MIFSTWIHRHSCAGHVTTSMCVAGLVDQTTPSITLDALHQQHAERGSTWPLWHSFMTDVGM